MPLNTIREHRTAHQRRALPIASLVWLAASSQTPSAVAQQPQTFPESTASVPTPQQPTAPYPSQAPVEQQPNPQQQPYPQPQPYPPQGQPAAAQQPTPPYVQPAPSYAQPAPPPAAPQPVQQQPTYAEQPPPEQPTYAASAPAVEPPPPPPDRGFSMPEYSIRVDPLNALLEGHLGVELEFELLPWLSIETIPLFIVNSKPVIYNDADELEQASLGLGPLAGAAVDLGFWLGGDTFNGTVLRVGFRHADLRYRSVAQSDIPRANTQSSYDAGEVMDEVNHSERRLGFVIGSHRTWGFFTLVGGVGLEYDLGNARRCINDANGVFSAKTDDSCDEDELQLALGPLGGSRAPDVFNAYGWLHPFYLTYRLSLGVVFE